jgi:hypothetical protein
VSTTISNPLPLPGEQHKSLLPYLTIHKLLPIAVLYFFFNSVGLPTGLFYTSILAPVFFIWLYFEHKRWLTLKFLLCLSPFIIAHAIQGVDSQFYYARSVLLLWTVYIASYAFCLALIKTRHVDRLFDQLIVLNLCAAVIALMLLPTPYGSFLWSAGFSNLEDMPSYVRRLHLLTLEPSHYGFEMVPLLIFAAIRLLQKPRVRNVIYVVMILVPLVLSQSFGSLSFCAAALAVALLPALPRLTKKASTVIILLVIVILIVGVLSIPNPLSIRAAHVEDSSDSSVNSRTTNGLTLAYIIASSKSIWWGVGLGQAKLQDVFGLNLGFEKGVIPNAIGATFAELGLIAILVKVSLEFYLFFRTRVYRDSFRLAMFVVAFLGQVTGSYLMNVQEYLTWFLAFAQVFPEVNLARRLKMRANC